MARRYNPDCGDCRRERRARAPRDADGCRTSREAVALRTAAFEFARTTDISLRPWRRLQHAALRYAKRAGGGRG